MSASIKKQAAKIANKAIRHADDQAKATLQEQKKLVERMEESRLLGETEGRDAFTNLRRLRGEKLPTGDEVVIARHLYDELPVLKRCLRARGMGIGEFCRFYGITDASETSKELHRLILAPGKNPANVRLRRGAGKYRGLIESISKITKESVSTLADRVLLGTSLHPAKQLGNLSEAEKVQTALQRIVDKIDGEFGLYAKFMEISQLKVSHVTNGGTEYWPMVNYGPEKSGIPMLETLRMEDLADATDPRFAFWPSGDDLCLCNRVLQDSNFFYVPHVPLGIIDVVNLPKRSQSIAAHELAVQETLKYWRMVSHMDGKSLVAHEYLVKDEWDPQKQCPFGQLEHDKGISCGVNFGWLIIYPTRDGSRLMPMLYISYEEGGPYILPLNTRSLEAFRDGIWLNETEHMSAFDRIKELLGYRPNTPRVIEDGFRRTAPWLDHNPFFKMKQQHADDLQMLDTFCQQQWENK